MRQLSKRNDRLNKLVKIRDAEIAVMKDCDVINMDVNTSPTYDEEDDSHSDIDKSNHSDSESD